jgi:DNA helicase-2/ATP-dependent DNA helicase PcrA
MSETRLRPSQETVLDYSGGKMGIAAVPGSGKTFTLSYLAAALVERLAEAGLTDEQEVLIVTFTNPAVNTFRSRIAKLVQQERGLMPYVGYRVRTLHGLAHDIVRTRPGLVGLSEGFEIVDERVTNRIIRELAENWLRINGDRLMPYVDLAFAEEESQLRHLLRRNGPELVESIGQAIIRLGKDNRWEPADMRAALEESPVDLPLARVGVELYEDYQRSLSYRGAVDFDDLVRLAMTALQSDPAFLERLQRQWPYILEDEAQDSSKLQNEMLRLLSGGRNWVRVGDPNQAIYTTFTTADSNLLRQFLMEPDVDERPLNESGRSSQAIIRLANELVRWAAQDEQVRHLSETFYSKLPISPTPPGDPQPNPEDGQIYLDWDADVNITPEREIDRVVGSLEKWLPDHGDHTVAVLVPENSRGFKVAEALKERGIEYEELLRSTTATRDAAARLQLVFDFLASPTSGRALGRLYGEVWWPLAVDDPDDEEAQVVRGQIVRAFQDLTNTEDFIWPGPEGDWLERPGEEVDIEVTAHLEEFRTQMQIWLQASSLPVDQLVLTVSQALFGEQADLALAHKIAVVLRGIAENNPDYRLPELSQELRLIAQNQRRFLGFDTTAAGYEPRRGVVTVATMHAAKGLEWDRVYLMAVNNYSFPSVLPADSYIAEKWFIRDELNIQAEAQEQAEALMEGRAAGYVEGEASREARLEYAAERLRLLYVGITRARRDLIITWNMGRFWDRGKRNTGAAPLIALTGFWKEELET